MAQMKLTITPTGKDPVTVPVGPKVIVECERHFNKPMGQLFNGENLSYESLAYAGWKAMMLSGYEVKTFDLWLDVIEDISAAEEDEAPLLEA